MERYPTRCKTDIQKKAYKSWCDQRQRCNNPKNPYFKHYGNRGISVKYSSDEFMNWFDENIKNFNGSIMTIGRIDHDKDYEIGNIEIQDKRDNSLEVLSRKGFPTIKRILFIDKVSNEILQKFDSLVEASVKTGISKSQLNRYLKGKCLKGKNFYLKGECYVG